METATTLKSYFTMYRSNSVHSTTEVQPWNTYLNNLSWLYTCSKYAIMESNFIFLFPETSGLNLKEVVTVLLNFQSKKGHMKAALQVCQTSPSLLFSSRFFH